MQCELVIFVTDLLSSPRVQQWVMLPADGVGGILHVPLYKVHGVEAWIDSIIM